MFYVFICPGIGMKATFDRTWISPGPRQAYTQTKTPPPSGRRAPAHLHAERARVAHACARL